MHKVLLYIIYFISCTCLSSVICILLDIFGILYSLILLENYKVEADYENNFIFKISVVSTTKPSLITSKSACISCSRGSNFILSFD